MFPYYFTAKPDKLAILSACKGKKIDELPTPLLLIDRVKFQDNCSRMLDNVQKLEADFRVHVKTHKTLEGAKLELGLAGNRSSRIIVSTLAEAWHMLPLVEEELVTDILFGLPVAQSKIEELDALSEKVPSLRLMVDDLEHVQYLAKYNKTHSRSKKWSLFIKIDMGTKRAGFTLRSQAFTDFLHNVLEDEEIKEQVELFGFYCHAGHSYGSDSKVTAKTYLIEEIDAANVAAEAALKINPNLELCLSAGATPTAHSTEILDIEEITASVGPLLGKLELHAGNYACCDLQQVATGCVELEKVSTSVLAEVVSTYPGRSEQIPGEQLINAGAIALSKDRGPLSGFGKIVEPSEHANWIVGRISQEHGVLVPGNPEVVPELIPLGTKIRIIPQHACLTCVAYQWFFVIEDGEVVDVWVPCKGW